MPSGASSAIEVTTRITATAGTSIVNVASLSAGGGEITMTNNGSSANVVVTPEPPAPVPALVFQTPEPVVEPTPAGVPTVIVTTGADTTLLLQLAIGALAIGFIVLGASRSRRRELETVDAD